MLADTGWIFLREETTTSKSRPVEQNEPLAYNHHLQPFLTFLKHERSFADSTIVSRRRSLTPFLSWLPARGTPLSEVLPSAISGYFTSAGGSLETDQRLLPCAVSALAFLLCKQSWLCGRHH